MTVPQQENRRLALTTTAGTPVSDNQNSLTAGDRGPVISAGNRFDFVPGIAVVVPDLRIFSQAFPGEAIQLGVALRSYGTNRLGFGPEGQVWRTIQTGSTRIH